MTDLELLKQYAELGSEDAFASLVGKYTNLVYSAAWRQMGNPQDAEDVSQVVFMILSRKATVIGTRTILPVWLLRTTRFVALNAWRRQSLRSEAAKDLMSPHQTETEAAWNQIAPMLDEALVSLSEKDRSATVLRFFEQKSFREIAAAMGSSDDAAQKRVSRAIEKLRGFFEKRGVIVPSVLVVSAITSKAVQAAPAQLLASITVKVASGADSLSGLARTSLSALETANARKIFVKIAAASMALVMALISIYQLRPKAAGTQSDGRLGAAPTAGVAAGPVADLAAPQPAQPVQRSFLLRIVDSQRGTPVARAQVVSIWSPGLPKIVSSTVATDRQGECLISFGPTAELLWNLRLEIQRDGYVRKFVNWAAARGDLLEEMNAEFTTQLEIGHVIGGLVVSSTDEPISAATVAIIDNYPSSGPGGLAEARREGLALTHTETTDSQGRWMCNHVPGQLEHVVFHLTHPDYIAAAYAPTVIENVASGEPAHLSTDDFRSQTSVMLMKPGIAVTGVVLDEERKPIAGANVTQNRAWTDPAANQMTGPDGRFRFGNNSGTDVILTAEAAGFVAADIAVHPDRINQDQCFALKQGAVLRGRVLDAKGRPISNANVWACGDDFSQHRFEWSTFTDTQGRFEWLSVPPLQKQYGINASGYKQVSNIELSPDSTEHSVTLNSVATPQPKRISGTVVDEETGTPVRDFQVWAKMTLRRKGSSRFPAFMTLAPELRTIGEHGKFSFLALNGSIDPVEKMDLDVRADGYLASSETVNGPVTNDCRLSLRLKPVAAITGTVELPDGQPAAGAVVVLCTKRERSSMTGEVDGAYMSSPGQLDMQFSNARHDETDAEGRFTLHPDTLTGTVLAVHKLGFFMRKLDVPNGSQTIRLRPFGRVAGSFRIASEPGKGGAITLASPFGEEQPPLRVLLTSVADGDGHFVFEGVPSGEWILSPHGIRVQVQSGETTQVVLGGGGRKVTGRMILKDPRQSVPWQDYRLKLATQVPGWPAPSLDQFLSPLDYSAAQRQWLARKSEFRQANVGQGPIQEIRQYDFSLRPDGTFSLDEVLPGSYDLQFVLDPLRYDAKTMNWLAGVSREVIIPVADGNDLSPLDLGNLGLNDP